MYREREREREGERDIKQLFRLFDCRFASSTYRFMISRQSLTIHEIDLQVLKSYTEQVERTVRRKDSNALS